LLLAGKTAVIVGIGPGVGEALALEFAAQGANLVLASRSSASVTSLAKRLEGAGSRAIGIQTDITQPDQCTRMATAAAEAFDSIDVLVNNAVQYGSNRLIESTASGD
jgi:NAD(P)-dependent dehydrogenase (short-subunit alcohol dehydrogenase family)